jgi:DNA-directed RNA polymerase sigma subunit (sigma70/sigma32)
MKRSEVVNGLIKVLERWNGCPMDAMVGNDILDYLEYTGFSLVDECGERTSYEPEEGWDAYIAEEDRKDNLKDFTIVEGATDRGRDIAGRFLKGETFEQIAQHYNVTRERIRQIVAKERRRYFKSIES